MAQHFAWQFAAGYSLQYFVLWFINDHTNFQALARRGNAVEVRGIAHFGAPAFVGERLRRTCASFLRLRSPHATKAHQIILGGRRIHVVPICAKQIAAAGVAAPPAINARPSGRRSLRIRLRARDVIGVPAPNPFRHVSGHVVQAVAVGRKTAAGTGVGHRAFVVVRMDPLGRTGDVHAQSQRRPRRPLGAPWA